MRAIEHIAIDIMIPSIKRTEAKTGVRGREATLVPSTVGTEPVEGRREKRRGREEGGWGERGKKEERRGGRRQEERMKEKQNTSLIIMSHYKASNYSKQKLQLK